MKWPTITSSLSLAVLLYVVLVSQTTSFAPAIPQNRRYRATGTVHDLATAASSSSDPPIRQELFVTAVKVLEAEIARQTGMILPTRNSPDNYAMAKLTVSLSIVGNPGLDLTEAAGLVLVTTVEGNAIIAGIKPRDTIIQVSVPAAATDATATTTMTDDRPAPPPPVLFVQDCAASSLDDLSVVLQTAVQHALQAGTGVIDLVLNRLLPIAYVDEQ
jgi:hypothetical protein